MREIVLDTETTGVEAHKGDRVVEIGCVELVNHCPTGRHYHQYINPERSMPQEAFAIHGLSQEFLSDKPVFAAIAEEFWQFIDGAHLVIHNAGFDVRFLDMELKKVGMGPIRPDLVVDTLSMARRKFVGANNTLDGLCSRFGIDNSRRTKHGALLDSEILAEVYIELLGGRQANLGFDMGASGGRDGGGDRAIERPVRLRPLAPRLTEAEKAAHEAFLGKQVKNALWRGYLGIAEEG